MVGGCMTLMPQWGTTNCDDYADYGTATTTRNYDYISVGISDGYDPWRQKKEDEQKKIDAETKRIRHMRSSWKHDKKRHEFRQKKWSMDKPKHRKRSRN